MSVFFWSFGIASLLLIFLVGPLACAPQEPEHGFKVTGKEITTYVTLTETNLGDGTHCVVVYSHGPSPGTAVSCDWHR